MKRIVLIIVSLFFCAGTYAMDGKEAAEIWQRANNDYTKGNYQDAIERYDSVLWGGNHGIQLYYNLANAHFKSGNIGKSIVNYQRALRLSPGNEDILYNLEIARGQAKNKVNEVPEFILYTWFKGFRASLSSDTWAYISLAAFALFFITLLIYYLGSTSLRRKVWFSLCCLYFVIFVWSLSFSFHLRGEIENSSQAVVVTSAKSVKSSPDNSGKDIFILNEGAEVEILENLGSWSRIKIASGNKGWIETSALETI